MNLFSHTFSRLAKLLVAAVLLATIGAPAAIAGTDTGVVLLKSGATGAYQASFRTDARDRSAGSSALPAIKASSSSAFQWGDAAVGAGLVLGLVALAGGATVVLRRQRGALRPS